MIPASVHIGLSGAASASASADTSAGVSVLRILVVEDNVDSQHLVCELLMALGHVAHGVGDGEQAWEMLQQQHFDVLFTDVSLPGMSGIELARQSVQRQPSLQVIIASGYGEQIGRNIKEGATEKAFYLPKPYDIDQLQDILRTICTQLSGSV